jgi:light-regulated signal transduction histidine kinase (bacteriophytochrome)
MKRSFRFQLALQFAGAMGAGLVIVGLPSFLAVRETLDREIEATLLGVASIQAGAATEADEGQMRLVKWGLTADETDLERIFQRFSRGDWARTRSPDTPGTGLGLAIAHAAAELHGAELTAKNRPDQTGAVFRVRFTGEVPERPQPAKAT